MAKTIAQLAQEAYERSKRTGVIQTKSGGTVASPVAQQQQAAVKAAQRAASTGNYGTTSGGTVKGTARPKAYTSGGGGVSQSERAAAYSIPSTPKVTVPTITAPTITAPKKKRNTGAALLTPNSGRRAWLRLSEKRLSWSVQQESEPGFHRNCGYQDKTESDYMDFVHGCGWHCYYDYQNVFRNLILSRKNVTIKRGW